MFHVKHFAAPLQEWLVGPSNIFRAPASSRLSTNSVVDFLPMTTKLSADERLDLLQGTLYLLILRTLRWGPMHGHGIAKFIQQTSQDVFKIEHGSLYPALQRLLRSEEH